MGQHRVYAPAIAGRGAGLGLAMVFGAAILLSAFLLFQVQPLISRYILPWFGGSPAVWTTAMLFFQLVLFVGYSYAHLSAKVLGERNQSLLHLALLMFALFCLPIVPNSAWKPISDGDPTVRILGLLAATVGVPYFVLSTTGPLLQAWFAKACPGVSPYRLYSLSNIGSLAALLSYPFFFEPLWELPAQAQRWSWAFGIFAALCAACAIGMVRAVKQNKHADLPTTVGFLEGVADYETPAHVTSTEVTPTWSARVLWVGLPAAASLMLLATTNFVCQDVAPVPLLWVIPLTLYLLTFIICFDHERWYLRGPCCFVTMILLIVAALNYAQLDVAPITLSFVQELSLYFATMFGVCMICHGEAVRLKPSASHLTEFYLLLSAGGAVGGIVISLVAPRVLTTHREWDICLALSFLIAAVTFCLLVRERKVVFRAATAVCAVAGGLLVAALAVSDNREGELFAARNFYGVVSVVEREQDDPARHNRLFVSGTVRHGRQYVQAARRREPLAYYGEQTAPGRTFRQLAAERKELRVGLIGLGVGTMATYARPTDSIRFYEINPVVETIARKYFTYLDDCAGECEVALGDARLVMEREPPRNYDLLLLDAFTGDSIPVHLLTKESFAIYRKHLKLDGIIVVHITNHYLDLEPVVRRLAAEFGFNAELQESEGGDEGHHYATRYMVLRPSSANAPPRPATSAERIGPLWTDHYSNLWQILKRQP